MLAEKSVSTTEVVPVVPGVVVVRVAYVRGGSANATAADRVCVGVGDDVVVGAVDEAVVPLLGAADAEVVATVGAEASACWSLGTTPAVASVPTDGAVDRANGKNSHITL